MFKVKWRPMACRNCGYVGEPIYQPGVGKFLLRWFTRYSLPTDQCDYCPKCFKSEMVPADSALGKVIVASSGQPVPQETGDSIVLSGERLTYSFWIGAILSLLDFVLSSRWAGEVSQVRRGFVFLEACAFTVVVYIIASLIAAIRRKRAVR